MGIQNFEKAVSRTAKLKNSYDFILYRDKNDLNNKEIIIYEYDNRDKFLKKYKLSFVSKKLEIERFYEFTLHFIHNENVRVLVDKNKFKFFNFPQKTVAHIKETSLSFNVKEINKGNTSRFKNLKIWCDEMSRLKEHELVEFLSKDEIVSINDLFLELKSDNDFKVNIDRYKLSAYRWCIRGLSVSNAIEKVKIDMKNATYFIEKNLRKRRYS